MKYEGMLENMSIVWFGCCCCGQTTCGVRLESGVMIGF